MRASISGERQLTDKLELLPLRQCVRPSGQAHMVFASRELLEWLSRPGVFQIAGYGDGVQVLAANELALAEAQRVLRQAYGSLISFDEPVIHSYLDPVLGVAVTPVMFLRIDALRVHAQPLRERLIDRGADLQEVTVQRSRVVMRAVARLADLLGFEDEVVQLTDGSAHVLSWLMGYEPASSRAQRARELDLCP